MASSPPRRTMICPRTGKTGGGDTPGGRPSAPAHAPAAATTTGAANEPAPASTPAPLRPGAQPARVGCREGDVHDAVGAVLDVDAAFRTERLGPFSVAGTAGDPEPEERPRPRGLRLRRHHARGRARRFPAHLAPLDDDDAHAPACELASDRTADHAAAHHAHVRGPLHGGGAERRSKPCGVITIVCSAR